MVFSTTMATKALASYLFFLVTVIATFPTLIQSQNTISDYDLCSPFVCGNLNFTFPFSSSETFGSGQVDCGLPGYQITCADPTSRPGILLSGRLYKVKNLFPSDNLITLVDIQLIKDLTAGSCASLRNLTINPEAYIARPFLPPWTTNLTLFQCPQNLVLPREFLSNVTRNYSCEEGSVLYVWQYRSQTDPLKFSPLLPPGGCNMVLVPVSSGYLNWSNRNMELYDVLADGFPLTWNNSECNSCAEMAGQCGFDGSLKSIVCLHQQEKTQKPKKQGLIIGVAGGGGFVLLIVVLLLVLRKRIKQIFNVRNQSTTGDGINAKEFIKTYQSSLLSNYSYNDMKKITSNFKEKLGEGGYGSVYKGRLSDGRVVAVKLLEKSNNIGHDFVNEVATIGRIHHVNVINLLGFSCNGSKQALIYEYMPNGSLGDLLSNEELVHSLGLTKLLEIAIEVAHGIEYLHNGCESRILHLDIKPQNVLLDQNFHPKLSDFGLAKVFSRSKSVVTMTDARGTIGYIAPEVFMRNLGNPSAKSDVYSYGMLLLEMVGRRKHSQVVKASTSSEEYFPSWVYEELAEENVDSVVEEDSLVARKMAMVGLWCIQINPKDRPSMTGVVEMLTGSLDGIELPPKPFSFSSLGMQQEKMDATFTESDTSALTLASDSFGLQN